MSNVEILHAYRHLLRNGLRAVQFSKPARFVVEEQLRKAFQSTKREAFDPEAVRRTIWFLKAAAAERGLEHKIVKNMVKVTWRKQKEANTGWKLWYGLHASGGVKRVLRNDAAAMEAYAHYEATIAMLNHSMGLCLPVR